MRRELERIREERRKLKRVEPVTTPTVKSEPHKKWWLGMEEVVYVGRGEFIDLNLNAKFIRFPTNRPIQVTSLQAETILRSRSDFRKAEAKERLFNLYDPEKGSKLFLMRNGGLGDVILLDPCFKKLKRTYPKLHITFSTDSNHHCLFEKSRYIDVLLSSPGSTQDFDKLRLEEYIVFNQNMYTERSPLYTTTSRMDIFAEGFGLELRGRERDLTIRIDPWYKEKAKKTLKELGWNENYPLVTIQLRGTVAPRTIPPELLKEVSLRLAQKGFQVCLIDRSPIGWEAPGIINAAGRIVDVGVIAGVLQHTAVHLGTDSGLAHLAAAMSTPAVVTTTTVPGDLRYNYYKNFLVLEPSVKRFPCYEGNCQGCDCIRGFTSEQMEEAIEFVFEKREKGFGYRVVKTPLKESIKGLLNVPDTKICNSNRPSK